jgi:branched-chain amino acid transport system permease protein
VNLGQPSGSADPCTISAYLARPRAAPDRIGRPEAKVSPMMELLLNALASGILLGGFYAAVTVGIAISFGMLDIGNLAHPAFIILGSFTAYILNQDFGVDPIVAGIIVLPGFFLLGGAIYETYFWSFERRGEEGLRGLAFFFGLLFITEVALILIFGVDYRFVEASYIGPSLHIGDVDLPLRMLVPFCVSVVMVLILHQFLSRTFIGRAILAVSQDSVALRLMAVNPTHIKRVAFAISIATASLAGACLIIIQPVEPSIGRDYIGRVFAVCVLGGMGSLSGMFIAGILLGIAENLTATFYGPSWSPAVAFGILLLTLGFRPTGIMGR